MPCLPRALIGPAPRERNGDDRAGMGRRRRAPEGGADRGGAASPARWRSPARCGRVSTAPRRGIYAGAAGLGDATAHAVTMTGELCDIFPTRAEGVAALCRADCGAVAGDIRVYGGAAWAGFRCRGCAANVGAVASANWHATASLARAGARRGAASSTWAPRRRTSFRSSAEKRRRARRSRRGAAGGGRAGLYRRDPHVPDGGRAARAVPRRLDAGHERVFRLDGRRPSHPRRAARGCRPACHRRRAGEDGGGIHGAPRAHDRARRRARRRTWEWRNLARVLRRGAAARDAGRRPAGAVRVTLRRTMRRSSAPAPGSSWCESSPRGSAGPSRRGRTLVPVAPRRRGVRRRLRAGGGGGAAARRRSGIAAVKVAKLLHQPVPGFALARAGGLLDGDREILQLARDLFARQDDRGGSRGSASSITAACARLKPRGGRMRDGARRAACGSAGAARPPRRRATASSQCESAAASRGTGPAGRRRSASRAGRSGSRRRCARRRRGSPLRAAPREDCRASREGRNGAMIQSLAVGDQAERGDVDRAGADRRW